MEWPLSTAGRTSANVDHLGLAGWMRPLEHPRIRSRSMRCSAESECVGEAKQRIWLVSIVWVSSGWRWIVFAH